MAYMHKKTFDIIQESNITNYLDDYFEVDDLIALPIQVLNRKGYYTQACRCGSRFDIVNEWFANERIPEDTENSNYLEFYRAVEVFEYEIQGNPKYKYRLVRRDKPTHAGYILFLPGVIPSDLMEDLDLPDGFYLEDDPYYENIDHHFDNNITYRYKKCITQYAVSWNIDDDETSVYDTLEESISDMRVLYDWALALPDLTACLQ